MPDEVVLHAAGLTLRYGALLAVDDLSLELRRGEVLGFLGPNGAGKTTSINMLCGLLRPDAGRVLLRGQPLASGDPSVRCRIGVCPQETVLWDRLTCLEQLSFVGAMYGLSSRVGADRGRRLLAELGLAEKAGALGSTLSGGMRRRLNLALALVHEPEVVVLDEPEAGLDPQSRVLVRDFIRSLAGTASVILTTHNMDEAERVAHRVAIIDHGRLLVLDTPDALKRTVGAGDVLELETNAAAEQAERALAFLAGRATVKAVQGEVTVRALDALSLLPSVVRALSEAGCQPGAVKVRQSSLEDVFLQLTGRRLRS